MHKTFVSFPRIFVVVAFLVFCLQPFKVGFEEGHHGWVSSHVLSQISRASVDNYFLGYSKDLLTQEGIQKDYFDRYPVIFAGTTHFILSPFQDKIDFYIYFARQWMNLIFLINLLLIWRIVKNITIDQKHAFSTFFLIASSSLFVKYKDMVHFDQPAILGCLLVLNGIIDFNLTQNKKFLVLGSLVGPLLGRGYAVIFFIFSWVLIEMGWYLFHQKKLSIKQIRVPILFLILSVPLPTLFLGYNVFSEAKIRNVAWDNTSIVVSAKHRLGLEAYQGKQGSKTVKWPSYITTQIQRFFDFLTPYPLYTIHIKDYKNILRHYLTALPKILFQLMIGWILIRWAKFYFLSYAQNKRKILVILFMSGIPWLIVMKNLASFHDYVTMYSIGSVIVVYVLATSHFTKSVKHLALYTGLIFVASVFTHSIYNYQIAKKVNWQASAFQNVRDELKVLHVQNIFVDTNGRSMLVPGVPYFEHFFLTGFNITYDKTLAPYQLSLESQNLVLKHQ